MVQTFEQKYATRCLQCIGRCILENVSFGKPFDPFDDLIVEQCICIQCTTIRHSSDAIAFDIRLFVVNQLTYQIL